MKLKLIPIFFIAFLCFTSQCLAVSGANIYQKYKKNELLMEKNINSMVMIMNSKGKTMNSKITVYKKGKNTRVETEIQSSKMPMFAKKGQKIIMIDDGITTTTFNPMMGKMSVPSGKMKEEMPESINLIGSEKINGIKCFKIETIKSGEKSTLWIAKNDYILVKESSNGSTTINSNFKKLRGFRFPWKIVNYVNGTIEQTSEVQSIKTNKKMSKNLFDPNKIAGNKNKIKKKDGAQKGMTAMEMVMEIQRLYSNGETEKAKELQNKLQSMNNLK